LFGVEIGDVALSATVAVGVGLLWGAWWTCGMSKINKPVSKNSSKPMSTNKEIISLFKERVCGAGSVCEIRGGGFTGSITCCDNVLAYSDS